MPAFERQTYAVNGVDTVVLSMGTGAPLVFFHGAGTLTRFDFAPEWARRFRVIVPYHPGFGESADAPEITEVHDYVLHYLELFERLRLERVFLVGQSMGGFIAAKFTVEHRYLVERLALVCPIGIPIPDHPTVNFLETAPEDLPALLAANPQTVIKHLPAQPDAAFIAERVKETATATRLELGAAAFDVKLPHHLHRLTMPTMLVWGKNDRLTPIEQHRAWTQLLPRAELRLFENAGHLVLDEAPGAATTIGDFFSRSDWVTGD
jgi:pimeloyl-ACP methyl ester carboxylesterase